MSRFKTLAVDSKPYAQCVAKFDACKSVEELTALILSYGSGQYNAKIQSLVVNTWSKLTIERGRFDRSGSLGETIFVALNDKVAQFGDKTFSLSERQAAAVARTFIDWTAANAVEVR